jgi:hypothetical protein
LGEALGRSRRDGRAALDRLWEIDWRDVEAIWVGQLATGEEALTIRPRERSALRLKGSRVARLIRAGRHAQLAARLFDGPLEDVVAALSEKTGRAFGTPPAAGPLF